MIRFVTSIVTLAVVVALALPAAAAPRHAVGLGIGGGVRASSQDLLPVGPELALPALELGFFGPREASLDLSIPVFRMMAAPLLVERLWIGFDAYRTFRRSLGDDAWAVAGPGLGWMVSAGAGNATGGLRLAGRVGVELRNPEGGFSTSFLLQPYVLTEFGDIGAAISGGATFWVRWAWIRPLP